MAVDIVIPAVGESVTSGVVQRWVKKDGEQVELDEIIRQELETEQGHRWAPVPPPRGRSDFGPGR